MNDKITVLCVDDEPLNLMLFELNFESKYNVIIAESGYLGMDNLRLHNEISIIISDMKMPGMDGLEFIKWAKNEFPDKIYMILSGFDITDEIQKSLDNQLIYKYFAKPFNKDEIEETIELAVLNKN